VISRKLFMPSWQDRCNRFRLFRITKEEAMTAAHSAWEVIVEVPPKWVPGSKSWSVGLLCSRWTLRIPRSLPHPMDLLPSPKLVVRWSPRSSNPATNLPKREVNRDLMPTKEVNEVIPVSPQGSDNCGAVLTLTGIKTFNSTGAYI